MPPSNVANELKSALTAKDTEKWLDAVAKADKEGWDGFQIQQALVEVVADDPVGTARFMENTHRPTQAMGVITMGEDCDEWEHQVHYHDAMLRGALKAQWSIYPRVPQEDPWADNVPKVSCEVVCPGGGGIVLTSEGMAPRGEPVGL
eukprot:TRINITY_DN6224_c0_g1_i1.p1 TRINITY_DN6224_c0_g1~~TRINITY_DN6224_c0_g1_i1.p1  ORF type:complete len:147 (+),score=27.11 TRINITY_DN6224_c0_g1_i1:86-526(+)